MSQAHRGSVLLSWPVTITVAGILLAILLGCMSISIGDNSGCRTEGDVLCQEGDVTVKAGCDSEVHYPIPYAKVPNLEVSDCFRDCSTVMELADCFRVRNESTFTRKVHWKARGLRAVPVVVPLPPPSTEAAPVLHPPAPVPSTPNPSN